MPATLPNAPIGAQSRDQKMVAAVAGNGRMCGARGTHKRITADTRSWETARTKAREYGDQHDPAKIAERTAGKAGRLHAFVGIMRSAGLSILDTTIQERTRLAVDDRLELYRHKTGEPVYLPLEPELADELRRLATIPGDDPRYFFWSGHGGPEHAADLWGKALRRPWPMVKPALDLARPLWPSAAA